VLSSVQVSQRVRRLDTAQSNLISTIDLIRRALDSGTCITAVQRALDAQDYEAAAANISRYQQLLDQCPNGHALPRGTPGSAYADHVVAQARDKLLLVVREKIAAACESRDMAGMLRFLQLYKPLNVPQEGMAAALAFVRRWEFLNISVLPRLFLPLKELYQSAIFIAYIFGMQ
jgi:hypothetical protein